MFRNLKKFFEDKLLPSESTSADVDKGIEYASAALFIELCKSDFEQDQVERDLVFKLLQETFGLDQAQLDDLVSLADTASADASDLYQFTSLINEYYDPGQKITLLENFWKIAYVDGRLDKYEEQFIRRIAGLINLPPSEFAKTKLRIKKTD